MADPSPAPLSDREKAAAAAAGIAVFADRLILEAQPPVDDAVLAAVAEHCARPLPGPLIELWRTAFGGSLVYDLRAGSGSRGLPAGWELTVLDWRTALRAGTLAGQRRLRRLALQPTTIRP